jgi:hypothetical protein
MTGVPTGLSIQRIAEWLPEVLEGGSQVLEFPFADLTGPGGFHLRHGDPGERDELGAQPTGWLPVTCGCAAGPVPRAVGGRNVLC